MQNTHEISGPAEPVPGWSGTPTGLISGRQLCRRPAAAADDAFLLTLFGQARPELGLLPESVREQLVRLQFEAQRRQYRADAPAAIDWILELRGNGTGSSEPEPVGRCYLLRDDTELRLLDLAVCPRLRGQGIGSSVLGELRTMAEQAGVRLRLSVWQANDGAIRLYRRLGFLEDGADGGHLRMLWTTPKPAPGSAEADNARGATDE